VDANGKINRGGVSDVAISLPRRSARPPTSATEIEVARLWSETLGVRAFDVDTDFFEAGGHSLLAMRLAYRLREVFDVDVSVRDIFDHASILGIADLIARGAHSPGGEG
jgi:hypothetical protein